MHNLVRMDLYRMRKAKSFLVCLIIAFACALLKAPARRLLIMLGNMLSDQKTPYDGAEKLSDIIRDPLPMLNAMLVMLSACSFFHADMENGYIKNIAGQMPKRGFSILSRFIAVIPHNLAFMAAGVIGNVIGTAVCQPIIIHSVIIKAVLDFLLKALLLQSICAILVLVSSSFRSKPLGTVLAVLLGTGLLFLLYSGISSGLNQLLQLKNFSLGKYMPDQLLGESSPPAARSILVSLVTGGIFLPTAIRVFDRRDVK